MNSNKYNVLVFPAGSEIGLEIYNSLQYSSHFNLIGASSIKDHAIYNYKEVFHLPNIDDSTFYHSLNTLIKNKNIDFVFPAHDQVIYSLAQNLNKIDAKIIVSPFETVDICMSKSKTYNMFKDLIKTPKLYSIHNVEFPVFIKPDVGNGSRGTAFAKNNKELSHILETSNYKNLLLLEFLPGEEFTVDCFSDIYGELIFLKGRKRNRIINGISVNTSPLNEYDIEIKKIANIINESLKLNGPWFFQLKLNKDFKLSLLEIGPRIAGSMALFRNSGVNFPQLALFNLLDVKLRIIEQDFHIELDRALSNKFITDIVYEDVYVDLDDCLIINDKINTQLIKFLFQCINDKKNVYLLTRHNRILNETLSQYKIANIFTEVFLINDKSPKSNFIKPSSKAIFIDDSFAEREDVFNKHKVPVFSPDAIECLIK